MLCVKKWDKFYICSSVHRNSRLKKSTKMQQYADIYLLLNYSTCFGRPSHPLSGVHKTVVAASGTDHTVWEARFFKQDLIWSCSKKTCFPDSMIHSSSSTNVSIMMLCLVTKPPFSLPSHKLFFIYPTLQHFLAAGLPNGHLYAIFILYAS